MESALVNARIPLAKKETANELLKTLGFTQSELINSAYNYLLETKSLPAVRETQRDVAAFEEFVANSSFAVDWGKESDRSYKDILREGKRADYESLA